MDKETLFDRFDTGLKVRIAGNVLTAVCLALRIFVFPNSVTPLAALIPLALGLIMSIFISAVVTDEEMPMEKYADFLDEFEEKHKVQNRILSVLSYVYCMAAVIMIIMKR